MILQQANARYDRQLRLWGSHGQRRLASSRVLILGSSVVATEILKSLVLPGLGDFTVLDDTLVSMKDLGENFFLEETDIARPRAVCVVERLKELNPDVRGTAAIKNPMTAISDEMLVEFDLVILAHNAASLSAATLLCEACKRLDRAFIFVQLAGMVGTVRLYIKHHTIIESKPDVETRQLWISEPFEELEEHCVSVKLDDLSDSEHAHIPYIIILIQACKAFREKNGRSPTLSDADQIRSWLTNRRRFPNEQNFTEALRNVGSACQPVGLPFEVVSVLTDAQTLSPEVLSNLWSKFTEDINDDRGTLLLKEKFCFWVTSWAVSQFVRCRGKPPCVGILPDLTSSTERFVALQQIYQARCRGDVDILMSYIDEILIEAILGFPLNVIREKAGSLDRDYVERFCQNILDLRALQYRSMKDELSSPIPDHSQRKIREDGNEDDTQCDLTAVPKSLPINWYILWQALDQQKPNPIDIAVLKTTTIPAVLNRMGLTSFTKIHDDYYNAIPTLDRDIQLHTSASVVGAVAAQEVIKICTGQFLPLNNTFIWDKGYTVEL